ncbi:lytic murein transglycosylase [Prosthecomicrobium pneumaticum]|uniref:Lytic murein transglycosylase n=1 Tax=Prosthecomicrobium pneumaticum TaxID=81895 RepID=A0A7W9L1M8_9HYPH|nr:lytic murein transglycosylase [Prosthecomicrobium pneumaticum]
MIRLILLAVSLLFALPAAAQSRAETERAFARWLAGPVTADARAAGISAATLAAAFAGLTLDWDLPDLAPPGAKPAEAPQRQAEFSDPARYFDEAKLARLAAIGRTKRAAWKKTLAAIEKRYGVPAEIVVAVWGRESGFGTAKMPEPLIRALATEAFMGARKGSFYPELLAALRILEEDHVPLEELRGSWAGAMGQPQFLPSKYLTHAVDFDGDGRRDIWRSVPDSLASIAHYLAGHGWVRGARWGVEVAVPATVSCTLEGPETGMKPADWRGMGIGLAGGGALRPDEPGATAHLLGPAGTTGPRFLVSENFYVLKRYNESDLYALFIGHLADRIAGRDGGFRTPWATPPHLTRAAVRGMQQRLEAQGHDVGGADGLVGYKTRIAIGLAEERAGRPATCWPSERFVEGLR